MRWTTALLVHVARCCRPFVLLCSKAASWRVRSARGTLWLKCGDATYTSEAGQRIKSSFLVLAVLTSRPSGYAVSTVVLILTAALPSFLSSVKPQAGFYSPSRLRSPALPPPSLSAVRGLVPKLLTFGADFPLSTRPSCHNATQGRCRNNRGGVRGPRGSAASFRALHAAVLPLPRALHEASESPFSLDLVCFFSSFSSAQGMQTVCVQAVPKPASPHRCSFYRQGFRRCRLPCLRVCERTA